MKLKSTDKFDSGIISTIIWKTFRNFASMRPIQF